MSPSSLTAHDAELPPADWARMVRRGLVRRCPRCGGGRLFRTWWAIKDRCPTCGLRFAREEGYFTGVYLLNFGFVLAVLFLYCMGFALWLGSHPGAPVVPVLVVGVVIAVVLPVLAYPFARTTWSAIDLAMMPMEIDEILEAAEASDDEPPGADPDRPREDGPDRPREDGPDAPDDA